MRHSSPASTATSRAARRPWFRQTLLGMVAALAVTGVISGAGPASAATADLGNAPKPQAAVRTVPWRAVTTRAAAMPTPLPQTKAMRADWPAAGTGTVAVPSASPAAASSPSTTPGVAAGLPAAMDLTVIAPATITSPAAAAATITAKTGLVSVPARVTVRSLGKDTASRLGGIGMAFTINAAQPGTPGGATVGIQAAVGGFTRAYGGDLAAHLKLYQLPACALETPKNAKCASPQVIPSQIDLAKETLTANVPVAAAAAGAPIFILAADPSSESGSYSATSIGVSSTWDAGGQSGDFSWNYPMPELQAIAGSTPGLQLGYSSQSVDGLVSSKNTQPTWTGLGWDLSVPYIERAYKGCPQQADNQLRGDSCWAGDILSISIAGHSSPLVKDAAAGSDIWRLRDDPGFTVQRFRNSPGNGDNDGEYWVVLTPEGTKYTFGRGQQPATGRATDSVFTVPVFGLGTGEPCHAATAAASWCQQAWRWNVDAISDAHGNTQSYFYTPETNYYQRWASTPTRYIRGGHVSDITYGQQAGQENVAAPLRIHLDAQPRCIAAAGGTGSCPALTDANTLAYPDVPTYLICEATATTCNQRSPSFFTGDLLRSVTAQRASGTTWADVDRVNLSYSFPKPSDGTDASLWLEKISRTGLGGGSTATLPDVSFTGKELDNRIDANPPGVPLMRKLRIATATDELGRVVDVSYGQPDPCGPANFPKDNADTNTLDCYPAQRVNGSSAAAFGWFYKYLVTSTTVRDTTGGSPPQTTRYTYRGGAAWHLEDQGPDPSAPRAHGDWRGYGQVDVSSMSDPGFRGENASRALSVVRTRYFRGMDGDPLANGTPKNVQITDSQGGSIADTAWLNGQVREQQQFQVDSAGNPTFELGGSITDYASARTVAAGATADPQQDAHLVVPTRKTARTTVIADGTGTRTTRTTRVDSTYDGYGQPLTTTNTGASAADVRCMRNTYARDAATVADGMLSYPYRIRAYNGPCAAPAALLSSTETYFDGSTTLGGRVTHGDPTRTVTAVTATGPDTPGTTITKSATFDSYGRNLTSTDGKGQVSRVTYTPATGRPQSATATNPLGQTTTLTMDADRGLPVTSRDANGQITTTSYDGLGRLTAVRMPEQAAGDPAAKTFAYTLDPARAKPARITTRQLQSGSTYLTAYQFIDSLARPRQQQTPSPASTTANPQTVLTDTRYDDRGQVAADSAPLASAGAAGSLLVAVAPSADDETRLTYDTAGRTTAASLYSAGALKWSTTTAYFGDHARTTPPAGGTAKTTWTDIWNRTTRSEDGTGASLVATTYRYDAADRVIGITDPAGHASVTGYDLIGRVTSSTDPDAGSSTADYDANGNTLRTTDAKGQVITTDYDALDRPTTIWSGPSGTGTKLHSLSYDSASITNGIGRPAAQSTYADGKTYTQSVTGYDPRGRPTATRWDFPAGLGFRLIPASFTVAYSYDAADHLTSVKYPDDLPGAPAETVSTDYDALGYARTLTATSTGLTGTTTTPLISDTGYASDGKLVSRSFANPLHPVTRQYSYETGTQRLSSISTLVGNPITSGQEVKQNDDYSWDPSGNLTRITDQTTVSPLTPNPVNTCYTYDGLDRLSHAWTSATPGCTDSSSTLTHDGPAGMNESWTYSTDGNITSARSLAVNKAYEYTDAAHPHAVTKAGLNTYSYDANGAMTSKVTGLVPSSMTWNSEHQLASTVSGVLANKYVYDATGSRLVRFNADGSATLYLDGEEINIVKGITTGTRYYSFEGTTVAIRNPLGLTWQLNDVQGSAQISLASGLSLVNRTYYDPYGAIRGGIGAGSPPTDHGFLGSVKDSATGLNQLGSRYYDSDLARFVSVDPANDQHTAQSANAYGYGSNNPIAFTDPTGLSPWSSLTHGISSAANWTWDHKAQIGGVALNVTYGVAGGIAVAGLCTATVGVGCVVAGLAGGALIGGAANYSSDVATGVEKNPSVKGFLEDEAWNVGITLLTAGAGEVLGAILRKPLAALAESSLSSVKAAVAALEKLKIKLKGGAGGGDDVGGGGGGDAPAAPPKPTGPVGPKQDPSVSPGGNGSTSGGGPGAPAGDGPVIFNPPPGATAAEIAQVKAYCQGCQDALEAGAVSPTGRVSTSGKLRVDANRSAAQERAAAQTRGTPYQGQAGHVPDTTWTGNPDPFSWLDLSARVNASLGGQVGRYPLGFKPSSFEYGGPP